MRISDWSSDVCSSDLPRDLKPVTREEVGASWYRGDAPEAAFGTGTTQPLAAGSSLAQAVADAKAGDTLALPAGTYDIAAPLRVQRRLTIAGAKDAKPVLRVASGLARIESGGGLRLENLRSEEHTSELQSLMRTSYAVF